MDTRIPFIFLLISLSTGVLMTNEHDSEAYNITRNRKKRQNGYMYEKPTISFDLPSRTTLLPATTQTQIVNQMQMYYAYPVPSAGKNNFGQASSTGKLDTGPIPATGTSGYNYESQNQPPIKLGKNSRSQIVSESGYNYERLNTDMNQSNENQVNVGYTTPGSATSTTGGNNSQNVIQTSNKYQNQNSITQGGGYTANNPISATRAGYNYEVPGSIGPGQTDGNTANILHFSNGAERGYSSEKQNTRGVTFETGALETSGGYNYDVQSTGINQAVGNTENVPETIATGNAGAFNYDKLTIGSNHMDGKIATVSISSIEPSVPESSGGYNYKVQSTNIIKANDNNVNIDYSSTENSGIGGYSNDQSQTIDTNQSGRNTDGYVGDSGYSYERQNNAVSQPVIKQEEMSVSTSAPTYLPPFQAVDKPSESYLPPQIKEISAILTVNSLTPALTTNSQFLPKPSLSSNYLTPAMVNPTLVTGVKPTKVQTIQSPVEYIPPNLPSVKPPITNRTYITPNIDVNQDSKTSTNLLNVKQHNQRLGLLRTNGHQYLPPTNSYSPTVSPPASTYLPPL